MQGAFSSTRVTYSAMSALPTVMTFSPEDNGQVVSQFKCAYLIDVEIHLLFFTVAFRLQQ